LRGPRGLGGQQHPADSQRARQHHHHHRRRRVPTRHPHHPLTHGGPAGRHRTRREHRLQVVGQGTGGLVAIATVGGRRAPDDRRRVPGGQRARGHYSPAPVVIGPVRRLHKPCQDTPQGEDVAARVGGLAGQLLGRDKARCPKQRPLRGERARTARAVQQPRDAEVHDRRPGIAIGPTADEDVGRLQVAVDHAPLVRVLHGAADTGKQPAAKGEAHAVPLAPPVDRQALHKLGHQERLPTSRPPRVVDRRDPPMAQRAQNLRLALQAVGRPRAHTLVVAKHLDGHLALDRPSLTRVVHPAVRPHADQGQHLVPLAQVGGVVQHRGVGRGAGRVGRAGRVVRSGGRCATITPLTPIACQQGVQVQQRAVQPARLGRVFSFQHRANAPGKGGVAGGQPRQPPPPPLLIRCDQSAVGLRNVGGQARACRRLHFVRLPGGSHRAAPPPATPGRRASRCAPCAR